MLPHLDAFDNHLAIILPRRLPRLPTVPEILLGRGRLINPRFTGNPILKPTVCTTDGNVEDEVKLLVERRGKVAGLAPRVDQTSPVAIRKREITAGPERLIEVGVEDLEETSVDVSKKVLLAPLHAKGVEGLRERRVQSIALHIGTPPGIVGSIWSPVESTGDDVVATLSVGVIVAPGFGNVNLARLRPNPISVFDGQHPDGGPEPVASWKGSRNLHATVFDRCAFLGVDPTRFDRIDDCAVGCVGDGYTITP